MNANRLTRFALVVLIAAMLGGAWLIVKKDGPPPGAKQDIPAGVFH